MEAEGSPAKLTRIAVGRKFQVPCYVGLSIRLLRTQLHPEEGIQEREKTTPTQKPQTFYNLTSEVAVHPFDRILFIRIKLLKSILGVGRGMKRPLLKRRASKNLWTYL